ncbi:putative secreted protein [Bordetella petrii]|uniref:Secreted protein n=2 Tax=Bordetella petrii TaxID=94624 RepID=A9IFC8_BORPD|nr:putative secreted protein [Bordetella petrii]
MQSISYLVASEETDMSKTHPRLSRRAFLASAAGAGAAAAGAVALPGSAAQPPSSATASPPAPAQGGGYRLSEHVKRYYKTTLV